MESRTRIERSRREVHAKQSMALLKDLVERLNNDSPSQRLLATVTVKFVGPAAEARDVLDDLTSDLRDDFKGITYVLDGTDHVPNDDPAAPHESTTTNPEKNTSPSSRLKPCEERAYWSYEHARKVLGGDAADKEAYEWLCERGPTEYRLPKFTTWARHVREGRRQHGTQRKGPRAGRTGRSVVSENEVEEDFVAKRPKGNRVAASIGRRQRLRDLAGDLYLCEDEARGILWKKAAKLLRKVGLKESCIEDIVRAGAPEELAEIAESLRRHGKPFSSKR
jgi:hypothetical protein